MQPARVALFGGSFNPPHAAHVLAAAYVLSVEEIDRVLVVPVWSHPFHKELEAFEHRVAMCRLAMQPIAGATVSEIESELGAPSRTLVTVNRLLGENPGWSLRLVIGADVLGEVGEWYAFDEIRKKAPPLILGRAGVSSDDAPPSVLPDVSSTEIRGALAGPRRETHPLVRRFVPLAVRGYITQHNLYR